MPELQKRQKIEFKNKKKLVFPPTIIATLFEALLRSVLQSENYLPVQLTIGLDAAASQCGCR